MEAETPVPSLSHASAASYMFCSTPLQEIQQPSVKDPYGINLAVLSADKDLLIYER